MRVKSQSYTTISGNYILYVPDLAFRKIISVKRNGLEFNIIQSGTQLNRDVMYLPGSGGFEFLNPFISTGTASESGPLPLGEKIFIIWDE